MATCSVRLGVGSESGVARSAAACPQEVVLVDDQRANFQSVPPACLAA